jgi:hypothetical protein
VTLCYPLSYGPCAAPSKEDGRTLEKGTDAYLAPAQDDVSPGRRRDIGPVRRVSSVIIGLVWPSPLPRRHHGHCSTIPNAVGVRGDKTPPRLLLCTLRPPVRRSLESAYGRRSNGSPHTATVEAAPGREQDSPRHLAETRFARMAITSAALYTIPPHVTRTVRYDCKSPPLGL